MRRFPLIALVLAPLAFANPADASVSIAVSFEKLVENTRVVGVFTPLEQKSVWEDNRIVTYTRCRSEEIVAGSLKVGDETWVATLGGRVGDVASTVDGEASLKIGRPTFLFLHDDIAPKDVKAVAGIYIVTARAQGQYRIELDQKKARHLLPASALGALLAPKPIVGPLSPTTLANKVRLAQDAIATKTIEEAANEIRVVWKQTHGDH